MPGWSDYRVGIAYRITLALAKQSHLPDAQQYAALKGRQITRKGLIMKRLILVVFLIGAFIGSANAAPTFTLLANISGAQPGLGKLLPGPNGVYYDTTENGGQYGYGSVIQLTPPSAPGGSWTETTLFSFNGTTTGNEPWGPLVSDAKGNLYGTTLEGGEYSCEFLGAHGPVDEPYKCGEVFELSPPVAPSTTWGFNYLHGFKGPYSFNDGYNPSGALVLDASGNVYGTTQGGGAGGAQDGTVFQLVPPSIPRGAWTENILYTFQGGADGMFPEGGLTLGPNGVLYGVTSDNPSDAGTVFSLTPGAAAYTFSTLYSFSGGADGEYPLARPILDASGNLYGTTQFGGVYKGNGYQMGSGGDECGQPTNCGTVYELSPSGSTWTKKVLYSFGNDPINMEGQITSWDGVQPITELTMDANGNLYGTTSGEGLTPVAPAKMKLMERRLNCPPRPAADGPRRFFTTLPEAT